MTVRVDAYFHPITMTYPIHPGPFFRAASNWEEPPNTLFLRSFRKGQTYLLSAFFISSRITTQRRKPSTLRTSWVYSLWPKVPSWIRIRWIQSATHRNNFNLPPTFGYVDCDAKFRSDIRPFHPWATFSRDIHTSLPKRPGPHIHGRRRQRSCPQSANTTFATPMATISHSHIQQCLDRNAAHFAQAFSC